LLIVVARQFEQKVRNPVLLIVGKVSDFSDGFFETLCHCSNLAPAPARFHLYVTSAASAVAHIG